MTITRVKVRQAERRARERRLGERRLQGDGESVGQERRNQVEFRMASRRLGRERRVALA